VSGRIPVLVPTNPFSATYLETKRARMSHVLPGPATGSDAPHLARATPGDGPHRARASNDGK
jgi:hypothetical protein